MESKRVDVRFGPKLQKRVMTAARKRKQRPSQFIRSVVAEYLNCPKLADEVRPGRPPLKGK